LDEKIQKAFEQANYMATLANQKQILKEEFHQNLIYFYNGGSFVVTKELINFTKTLVDIGNNAEAVLVDSNDIPVDVHDLNVFLENLLSIYHKAVNEYYTRYTQLRTSRTTEKLITA
jgi:hypothetical protein